ncbi:prepilin-type N-terminal cleavage/methylation domain-containing protein [Elusimicrobium simillimum]|uniref:type IV pilin protein n=1 Tax=Elusimicrobium simillimum TaxID=3143438 RepID=UPI003C705B8A
MKKGFTLIELLVVVLIIGILAAIALPQYTKAVEKSRAAEAMTTLKALQTAGLACRLANSESSCWYDDLDIELPNVDTSDGGGELLITKNFEYSLDEGGAENAYAWRVNSAYDYHIQFFGPNYTNDTTKNNKRFCTAINDKGKQLCAAIGGKNPTASGDRTEYELN